tara:strand:- start:634 stop:912 length:279 start_codon:yes stop_codon:yes gene_type:complete
MSNFDISKVKLPIVVVAAIMLQFFGIVWYISSLDSTVDNLSKALEELKGRTSMDVLEIRIKQLEATDKLLDDRIKEIQESSGGTSFSLFGSK